MKTGRNIRAIRRRRGLTLDELSALCGVSRDELGRYERGQTTPRPGTVEKLAQALGVPIAAVREGIGWTAQEPLERWETEPLRDSILEAVRAAQGADFTPEEGDVRLLMESVKAAIPALVERMKDTRPQSEIHRELLAELGVQTRPGRDELVRRYALTDGQWAQVEPLLPPENAGKGRACKSSRLMLDGIVYHLRTGTAWKDLPACFGPHKCVSGRLRLWRRAGVWEPVLEKLRELGIAPGL